jgi:hypothetical protein
VRLWVQIYLAVSVLPGFVLLTIETAFPMVIFLGLRGLEMFYSRDSGQYLLTVPKKTVLM